MAVSKQFEQLLLSIIKEFLDQKKETFQLRGQIESGEIHRHKIKHGLVRK